MIYVFIGPTINSRDAAAALEATCLPPVAQGDVYRAALERPWAIAIVDGYFERVPSVWHKEILWAMSQGIHVFGAASMGALRAAELEAFGMVGVGEIFKAYRDGELEDDDEVAVAHGGPEEGFRPASEAMVNIRATLQKAVAEGVIDLRESRRLIEIGKELHYPLRDYPTILRKAREFGFSNQRLEQLAGWIRERRVDQKREDALKLLRRLASEFATRPEPKQVSYVFQRTQIWEQAIMRTGRSPLALSAQTALSDPVLDELRLRGRRAYAEHLNSALLRELALEEARRQGLDESVHLPQARAAELRRSLDGTEPVNDAAENRELTDRDIDRIVSEEARFQAIRRLFKREAGRQLDVELRLRGISSELRRRAGDKQRLMTAKGLERPDLDGTGLDESELLAWFFEKRLGEPVPEDLHGYAQDLDLEGADVLRRLILQEYLYEKLKRSP